MTERSWDRSRGSSDPRIRSSISSARKSESALPEATVLNPAANDCPRLKHQHDRLDSLEGREENAGAHLELLRDRSVEQKVDVALDVLFPVRVGDRHMFAPFDQRDLLDFAERFVVADHRPTVRFLHVAFVPLQHASQSFDQARSERLQVVQPHFRTEEFLETRRREEDVERRAVVDRQSQDDPDQVVLGGRLERGWVEPDVAGLRVGDEHAVVRIEQLAAQEQEPLFLEPARSRGVRCDWGKLTCEKRRLTLPRRDLLR